MHTTPGSMDFGFLVYLADTGATDIHPLGRVATRALIAQLDLHPHQRVLEVGCGTGGTLALLAQSNLARIDGVDAIPAMLHIARRRMRLAGHANRSALHLVEPGGRLPFPDSSYDRVYTESVLGFQDELGAQALLTQIFRVLRRGGRYVANEAIWRAGVPSERIASINAACLADFGVRMASAAPWTLDDWLGVMEQAGFRAISANLVQEHLATTQAEGTQLTPRTIATAALTSFYRLRSHFLPAARRARARYRILNQQHRDDGLYIEPRLFVLEKPFSDNPRHELRPL